LIRWGVSLFNSYFVTHEGGTHRGGSGSESARYDRQKGKETPRVQGVVVRLTEWELAVNDERRKEQMGRTASALSQCGPKSTRKASRVTSSRRRRKHMRTQSDRNKRKESKTHTKGSK